MSALAASTSKVTIGPLVACAGFHPPGLIAKMAATIDEVSGGRFMLGLGSGWNRREFAAFGIPYDQRVSRFEEAFTIIRGLLAGERVTLDGTFHPRDDVVLLPRRRARAADARVNGPRMHAIAAGTATRGTRGGRTTATRPRASPSSTPQARRATGARPGRSSAARACSSSPTGAAERRHGGAARSRRRRTAGAARRQMAEAGADEVILVASPITERSIRALGGRCPQRRAPRPSLPLFCFLRRLLGADQLLRLALGRDPDDVPRRGRRASSGR